MNARLGGVALQLTALAVFVCMDTILKLLTARYAVPQLMWARFFFGLLAVALFFRLTMGRLPWRSHAPGLQAIRSLLLAGSNIMFSTALAHLPLTDATAIGFASPLFTVALAAAWLREKVGLRRWIGVGIGFVGVLVALRPPFLTGGAPMHWAAILPLGTAFTFAIYQILTRKLATIDDPRTTILHTGLAATLAASLAQPLVWTPPDLPDWGLLAALGLLGGAGHGLLVLAYARAPASLLAPMSYTQLIWASVAGVLVFADWPDATTLLGAAVIALGGVLVALPDRRAPAR
ncbi:DMT family transporter [Paracraurococcus ruber]|uniref:EamA family transporter n=1 Tax=Paracraurococcus ruber TaxID=77675 RepID=A0ABS1D1X0_9PROT|nr:DMT family transporter [Paracraurococcus ruber]MBK1660486.1 EamA family transporter [Paracraurococcus ruber]TDG13223.1 DMT family transporter [Paracraurococcus ruber]